MLRAPTVGRMRPKPPKILDRPSQAEIETRARWWLTPRGSLVARVLAALDKLQRQAEGEGLGWPDAMAARELVKIGLSLLADPTDVATREVVRRLDETRQGRKRRSPDLIRVEMVRRVALEARWWAGRNRPAFAALGGGAPARLHRELVALLGQGYAPRMPSIQDLTTMLDLHAPRKAQGKITTIGIVANILIATGALGTGRHIKRADVLRRVDNAARRCPQPIAGLAIPPPIDE
jgi:hypothetical protein